IEGTNVDDLKERVHAELPERERERLVLPLSDDAMSLVSWVHDHANVEAETYEGEQVVLEFEARPSIVERARDKASDLTAVDI
ncbi:MAG: GTPase HflX, partial [Haloplanus sp.]